MKSPLSSLLRAITRANVRWFALWAITSSCALAATDPLSPHENSPAHDRIPEGLTSSDWNTIRDAYEAARHSVRPTDEPGVWEALNPHHQWRTRFDEAGFLNSPGSKSTSPSSWTWGLSLKSYGWDGREKTRSSRAGVGTHERFISYRWDADVTEWFSNDRSGLEHGFTVNQRPQGQADRDMLSFTLAIRGTLVPSLSSDGTSIDFADSSGWSVLTYDKLKVWDAEHKPLPARFSLANEGGEAVLRLQVDATNARYPITIDPTARQAYIKASNPGNDDFGHSVSLSGDTLAVGAPFEQSNSGANQSNNSLTNAGAVYVFVRSGTTWTQQAYIKPSVPESGAEFGRRLALDGNTLVVGAHQEGANDKGAAYVFVRSGTTWSQQARFQPATIDNFDLFGDSVGISGDTIVVGTPFDDSNANTINGSATNNSASSAGAAYVFVRSGTTWSQEAYLKASNSESSDEFGQAVAISGNTVAVSAIGEASNATTIGGNQSDNSAAYAGAVYVFTRSGTTWTQQAYIKSSNAESGDALGEALALDGDTLVAGSTYEASSATGVNPVAPAQANNDATEAGAVYVFVRNGTTWSQQAYIKASNTDTLDRFGWSVSISGNTLIAGAVTEGSAANGINPGPEAEANNDLFAAGAAYIFVRDGTTWSQQAYLKMSKQMSDPVYFGWGVSISGETAVVGAPLDPSLASGVNPPIEDEEAGGGLNVGSASVYVRYGTVWEAAQEAYVKPSNMDAGDRFGRAVATSGDTVVIGAPGEDGSGVGINPTQDNGASEAGAVYIFVRSGTTWNEQAYIKATNTGAGDAFGISLAISGNTLVVGAINEDSSATGVNGNQLSNSFFNAGAAYVFVRSGTTWSQQAYLKASNTDPADNFGGAVAIDGDTIVVGATGEDSDATGVNGNQASFAKSGSGAAYVFTRSGTTWTQVAYLKASNPDISDSFGSFVAISGDVIVSSAHGEDGNGTGVNPGPTAEADNSKSGSGAVYVFRNVGGTWAQEAYVKASNSDANDSFAAVDISGNTIVVGASGEQSNVIGVNPGPTAEADNSGGNVGAVYVFQYDGFIWEQEAYIKGASESGTFFGSDVALSHDTLLIGAAGKAFVDNTFTSEGAAYVYTRAGVTWDLGARIAASNYDSNDGFGLFVAINNTGTCVIGAWAERSNASGINPGPTAEANNSAAEAGAAYIFSGFAPPWTAP